MLVELSKVEQRYDAVLSVNRDGLTVSEAALTYGVRCQSIYRRMQRYEQGGLAALAQRSTDPNRALYRSTPGSRIGSSPCAGRTPKMESPGANVVRDPPGVWRALGHGDTTTEGSLRRPART